MSLLQVDIVRNRQGDGSPEFDRGLSVSGVITSTSLEVSSIGIGSTEIVSSSFQLKNITSIDSVTLSTLETALEVAPNTFNSLYIGGGGISTFTGSVYVSGITTVNNDLYVTGTLFSGSSGASISSLSIGSTQVISSARELQNITSLDSVTTATIENAIQNSPNTFDDLQVLGISTFNNSIELLGDLGMGPDTQIIGERLLFDRVGLGTSNPTSTLTVIGDTLITGILTASNFIGITTYSDVSGIATYAGTSGIATYAGTSGIATYAGTSGIATNVNGGTGFLTQLNVTGVSTFNGVLVTGLTSTTDLYVGAGATFAGITTFITTRQINATVYNVLEVDGPSWLDGGAEFGPRTSDKGLVSISTTGNISANGITTTGILNVGSGGTILTTTSEGFIGIGTTIPETALTVNGVISFSNIPNNPSGAVGNVKIGDSSTATNLTFGDYNTFIGSGAGNSTTSGSNNIFIGRDSGFKNLSGFNNIFLGYNSGYNNTGFNNIFISEYSGYSNTSGQENIFLGYQAGYSNTTGRLNLSIGIDSLISNETGRFNTSLGHGSGYFSKGERNNFFGYDSGHNNTTGFNNLYLGSHTGISTSASHKVIIGVGTVSYGFDAPDTNKSTQLAIGVRKSIPASQYWIVGNENFDVGIGTTNPTSKLDVVGDANISGVVTATGGFISVGNTTPIQISLVGNQLTFTAVGIGSTTLILA